ncbi:MAG: hypothetical protein J0665_06395 [Deltaproteobacteria bacterium]|nr:hypothetical protein [Deltaproteobacteria bacterium]
MKSIEDVFYVRFKNADTTVPKGLSASMAKAFQACQVYMRDGVFLAR